MTVSFYSYCPSSISQSVWCLSCLCCLFSPQKKPFSWLFFPLFHLQVSSFFIRGDWRTEKRGPNRNISLFSPDFASLLRYGHSTGFLFTMPWVDKQFSSIGIFLFSEADIFVSEGHLPKELFHWPPNTTAYPTELPRHKDTVRAVSHSIVICKKKLKAQTKFL